MILHLFGSVSGVTLGPKVHIPDLGGRNSRTYVGPIWRRDVAAREFGLANFLEQSILDEMLARRPPRIDRFFHGKRCWARNMRDRIKRVDVVTLLQFLLHRGRRDFVGLHPVTAYFLATRARDNRGVLFVFVLLGANEVEGCVRQHDRFGERGLFRRTLALICNGAGYTFDVYYGYVIIFFERI